MNTIDFLKHVLPEEGTKYLVVGIPVLDGEIKRMGMRHMPFTDLSKFEAVMVDRDKQEENTIYFACAAYKKAVSDHPKKKYRSDCNWLGARSFWMDVDCGPKKPYATWKDGFLKLKEVLKAHALPYPTVVSSGNGLHLYWVVEETITDVAVWYKTANLIHEVMLASGFQFDTTKTRDPKAVLRPVGSFHKKDPANHKPVRLAVRSEVLTHEDLFEAFSQAASDMGIGFDMFDSMPEFARGSAEGRIGKREYEEQPSSAEKIAERCQQIKFFKDARGDVGYEFWRPVLGVLGYCEDKNVMFDWSSGHAGYSHTATQEEFDKWQEGSGSSPTRCDYMAKMNPSGCDGCEYQGKVTTPLQLGRSLPEAQVVDIDAKPVQPVETAAPEATSEQAEPVRRTMTLPEGYSFTPDGGMQRHIVDEDGIARPPVRFLSCRLLMLERVQDDKNEYHMMLKRISPYGEEDTFEVPAYMLNSQSDLVKELGKRDVILDNNNKAPFHLTAYLRDSAEELRRQALANRTIRAFGWSDDMERFAIGREVYHKDGTVTVMPKTKRIEEISHFFPEPVGSLELYSEAINRLYAKPGSEVLQYAFCSGYGSILNVFGEILYNGVSFILFSSDTAAGKSTVCLMSMAGFGHYASRTIGGISKGGTINAIMKAFATARHMPILLDEVSQDKDVEVFRGMSYTIADGKDKLRLNQDSSFKMAETWRMTPYVTTNRNLQSLIDPEDGSVVEAQKVRVVQIDLPKFGIKYDTADAAGAQMVTDLTRQVLENSGHAGRRFIQYVVTHQEELSVRHRDLKAIARSKFTNRAYRFFIDHFACTVLAGEVLAKLGIANFKSDDLISVGLDVIRHNAENVNLQSEKTSEDVFTSLIDYLSPRIVKTESLHPPKGLGHEHAAIKGPGILSGRWVISSETEIPDEGTVNTLYLRKSEVARWCTAKGININWLLEDLTKRKVYRGHKKMRLGTGLDLPSTNVESYIFDMRPFENAAQLANKIGDQAPVDGLKLVDKQQKQ